MITIIVSTNRKNSYSARVADYYHRLLTEKGQASQVLWLGDLPADFPFTQIHAIFSEEFDNKLKQHIIPVEKFIFIIPEYNGGYPGILKAFIDGIPPKHFRGKKAAFCGISSGRGGAMKAMDDFTGIMHYLQVEVLSDKPKITGVENVVNDKNEIASEEIIKRIHGQVEKFLRF